MSRHRRPDDADEPVGAPRDDARWAPPTYLATPTSAAGPAAYVPRRPTPPQPSAARARKPAKPARPARPAKPSWQAAEARGRLRLRINPITCAGHGLCAELLPELLGRDDWGYPAPIVAEVPAELEVHAQRAAQQCPTLAILLDRRRPRPGAG